jgi:hypothetical protein
LAGHDYKPAPANINFCAVQEVLDYDKIKKRHRRKTNTPRFRYRSNEEQQGELKSANCKSALAVASFCTFQ